MVKPVIGVTCVSTSDASPRLGVNQTYIDAVTAAGGVPVCIPAGIDDEVVAQMLPLLDGLLLPGGTDVAPEHYRRQPHPRLRVPDPDRDRLELALTRLALLAGLPILGICRGMQVLAIAGGGALYQDLPSEWGTELRHEVTERGRQYCCHAVQIDPESRLAGALGVTSVSVNSFHHQAVLDVPDGFEITARAPDGLIEGMEKTGPYFAVGVQCHPEEIWTSTAREWRGLFNSFVAAGDGNTLALAV
jgi:putative glutamine amidotransferase